MTTPKVKIAMVDDDTSFLEETAKFLEESGYQTATYSDPRKAFEALESLMPDCLLLDMKMPILDGQDLLLLIRRKFPDLPVVICTGVPDADERYLIRTGAREILKKPFTAAVLIKAIEDAVSDSNEVTPVILQGFDLRQIQTTVLRKMIIKALTRANFNATRASELLGISRQCLFRHTKRLQINF